MAETKVGILLEVQDRATAALKSVSNSLENMQDRIRPAAEASQKAALAFAGAATAIGGFAVASLKSAASAEQTQIALTTMLGSAEKARQLYGDLVSFAAKTPFELKGLEVATKQLLAYGFTQQELIPNLKALGDIASGVGMDKLPNLILAFGQVKAATHLTGMELRQFTEAGVPLLQALADQMHKPVSAIQEMVSAGQIGFPMVQQALMDMTKEGGKFNDLMAKQSASLGGMWSNLQDAWEQFLRGQGAGLIEWAKQFVVILIDIVQNKLPQWIEKIKDVTAWLTQHKVVLAAVIGMIVGALVPAIWSAVLAFGAMAAELLPFVVAGGAIAMLVQGIREGNIWLTALAAGIMTLFIPTLVSLATTIYTTVIPAAIAFITAFFPLFVAGVVVAGIVAGVMWIIKHWDMLTEKAGEIANAIGGFFVDLWHSIEDIARDVWNAITGFLSATWQGIKDVAAAVWGGIVDFFTAIWNGIVAVFKFALALVVGLVIEMFNAMGIDIVQVITDVYNKLVEWWTAVQAAFDTALNFIKTLWETVWTAVRDFFVMLWAEISAAFSETMSALSAVWQTVWSAVRDFLAPIVNAIKNTITGLWTWIKSQFESASKPVANAWKAMWDSLTSAAEMAWEGVRNTVKSSINWIIDKVNTLINAINEVARKGAGAVGFNAPQIPNVPMLAQGGIVTRPTLAMVGEGGEPEAVIPLSKLGGAGIGGITINIMGGNYLSEDAGLALGNQIIEVLRRNMKL